MNANQLMSMAMRMIMRRVMRSGVDLGVGAVSKRMSKGKVENDAAAPQSGETQKRARQSMKIARRMGRM